jgi:hypothetical protein
LRLLSRSARPHATLRIFHGAGQTPGSRILSIFVACAGFFVIPIKLSMVLEPAPFG